MNETSNRGSVDFDFTEREVLVTGASRGIGLGVATAFLQCGASVTLLADDTEIESVAEQLTARFERPVRAFFCDITDAARVAAVIDPIKRIDVLINNAGIELATPMSDPDRAVDENFRRIIEVNILGTFTVTRHALPKIPSGGRIVITSSMWGKSAVADFSAYCASKHANIGFMRSLAHELAPRSISVNAVCPGWVKTVASMRSLATMAKRSGRDEAELLDEIMAAQAFDGLMEPSDVAQTYLFLASDAARNITGQAVTVDRGELMQ